MAMIRMPSNRPPGAWLPFDKYTSVGQRLSIEEFTLLVIGLGIITWRTCSRTAAVRLSSLQVDDYLMGAAAISYCAETGIAFAIGNDAHNLNNSGMTAAQRAALDPSSHEYYQRVLGSKLQLASWINYCFLLWCLKSAMLSFYLRLTEKLEVYRTAVYVGFALANLTAVAVVLDALLICRPLHKMWQIHPDPGVSCQPSRSPGLAWTQLALNLGVDCYIVAIFMPLLFKINASISKTMRTALVALFCAGVFISVAAVIRTVRLAGSRHDPRIACVWTLREVFVAVVTTSAPVIYPSIRRYLPRLDRPLPRWPIVQLPRSAGTGRGILRSYQPRDELSLWYERRRNAPAEDSLRPAPAWQSSGVRWADAGADPEAARAGKSERGGGGGQDFFHDFHDFDDAQAQQARGDSPTGPETPWGRTHNPDSDSFVVCLRGSDAGITMSTAVRVSCVEERDIRQGRPGVVRMGNYTTALSGRDDADDADARRPSMLDGGFDNGYWGW